MSPADGRPGGAIRFRTLRAVLFDLDGTLADTAPDLAKAANAMRSLRGLAPLPLASLRPFASQGARGLLHVALDKAPEDPDYEALRDEFLSAYGKTSYRDSALFEGMPELLDQIETLGLQWGIVTNKIGRFTTPLVERLGVSRRAAVVVSGDTTAHSKPHPAPLQHAAASMGLAPSSCVYVGDDLRDVHAAHAAGMRVVAASYGYCGASEVEHWEADAIIASPGELPAVLIGLDAVAAVRHAQC